MFALSTSWNALQHSQAKDIIKEIKGLGFKRVELSFNLSPAIVEEMLGLKEQGLISVVSVHNFCPVPEGISPNAALPDIFSLSALNEDERQKALQYTKRTIDTASRIAAEAVVLHLGKVQIEEKIKRLVLIDQIKDSKGFGQLKKDMEEERKEKSKQFFDRALKSLESLCSYAQKRKVNLGIENRYYFSEIPSLEEMEIILKTFPGPPLYYWHDVGHAQVYENLKFLKHQAILDKFKHRIYGMHLHDIEGIDDHRAPLKGKFDFSLLKNYITKDTLKVLEPHYPATAQEIIRGREYLEGLFKND